MLGQREGLAHMLVARKLLKILTGEHVPIALEMRPSQLLGKRHELLHIVGVGLHQHCVIPYSRGYESIILRALVTGVPPVDKKPFNPAVANVSRVAGIVHARLEAALYRAVARRQKAHLLLGEVRRLLHAYYVVLLPLILIDVVRRVAVTKLYARPVPERKRSFGDVVFCRLRQLAHQRYQVVFSQLGQCAAQQERIKVFMRKRQQHELSAHCPAFTASARSAVRRMACR